MKHHPDKTTRLNGGLTHDSGASFNSKRSTDQPSDPNGSAPPIRSHSGAKLHCETVRGPRSYAITAGLTADSALYSWPDFSSWSLASSTCARYEKHLFRLFYSARERRRYDTTRLDERRVLFYIVFKTSEEARDIRGHDEKDTSNRYRDSNLHLTCYRLATLQTGLFRAITKNGYSWLISLKNGYALKLGQKRNPRTLRRGKNKYYLLLRENDPGMPANACYVWLSTVFGCYIFLSQCQEGALYSTQLHIRCSFFCMCIPGDYFKDVSCELFAVPFLSFSSMSVHLPLACHYSTIMRNLGITP